jgi:dUTPase
MNSYNRLLELNTERLEHWPPEQLKRATDGSVGYDLKVADTIVVPSLKTLEKRGEYSWLAKGPLSLFSEGQQRDIRTTSTEDPLGIEVLDKDLNVVKQRGEINPISKGPSFYINEEGIVHCKMYKPFFVRTGVKITPSERCWLMLSIRSGIATKFHINLLNGVGIVDPDYPGEYLLALSALRDDQILVKGERVAQMIVCPFIPAVINHADRDRDISFLHGDEYGGAIGAVRIGGFGSTGI